MGGAIRTLPQYTFMSWCLVKHKDNFTFTFTSIKTPLYIFLPTDIVVVGTPASCSGGCGFDCWPQNHLSWVIWCFFSVPACEFWDIIFHNYPPIQCHITYAIEKVSLNRMRNKSKPNLNSYHTWSFSYLIQSYVTSTVGTASLINLCSPVFFFVLEVILFLFTLYYVAN
jgi:hypothetical protein